LGRKGIDQAGTLAAARAICAALGSCLAKESTPAIVITVTMAAKLKEAMRWRMLLLFMVRSFALGGALSME
jgi:hypothetical protein